MRYSFAFLCSTILLLPACDTALPQGEQTFPKTVEDRMILERGKIGGGGGLFSLGGSSKKDGNGGPSIGVSGYLWRATLDTLSFMPLVSADPFGGTVITDWYSPADKPDERFKINALILSQELRADGIKVKLFKQLKDAKGNWKDATATAAAERKLEDTILTRARELKVQSLEEE